MPCLGWCHKNDLCSKLVVENSVGWHPVPWSILLPSSVTIFIYMMKSYLVMWGLLYSKGYYLNLCNISFLNVIMFLNVDHLNWINRSFWFCLLWALRCLTFLIGNIFVFGSLWQLQTTFFFVKFATDAKAHTVNTHFCFLTLDSLTVT